MAFSWLINGGDPNYLTTYWLGWSSKYNLLIFARRLAKIGTFDPLASWIWKQINESIITRRKPRKKGHHFPLVPSRVDFAMVRNVNEWTSKWWILMQMIKNFEPSLSTFYESRPLHRGRRSTTWVEMKARNNIHPRRLTAGTQKTSPIEKKEKILNQTSEFFGPKMWIMVQWNMGVSPIGPLPFKYSYFSPAPWLWGKEYTMFIVWGGIDLGVFLLYIWKFHWDKTWSFWN